MTEYMDRINEIADSRLKTKKIKQLINQRAALERSFADCLEDYAKRFLALSAEQGLIILLVSFCFFYRTDKSPRLLYLLPTVWLDHWW